MQDDEKDKDRSMKLKEMKKEHSTIKGVTHKKKKRLQALKRAEDKVCTSALSS